MKGDILYTVLVNNDMKKIVVECKTINSKLSPEVGYVLDDFSAFKVVDWDKAITSEYGSLDEEKAFKTPGIYEIDCLHYEGSEPENGWYSESRVLGFRKICELPYKVVLYDFYYSKNQEESSADHESPNESHKTRSVIIDGREYVYTSAVKHGKETVNQHQDLIFLGTLDWIYAQDATNNCIRADKTYKL